MKVLGAVAILPIISYLATKQMRREKKIKFRQPFLHEEEFNPAYSEQQLYARSHKEFWKIDQQDGRYRFPIIIAKN